MAKLLRQIFGVYTHSFIKVLLTCVSAIGVFCVLVGPLKNPSGEYYQIISDGTVYGIYETKQEATEAIAEARMKANENKENIVLSEFSYTIETTKRNGDSEVKDTVTELCQAMLAGEMEQSVSYYTLKTGSSSVVLETKEEIIAVLNNVVNAYDVHNCYEAGLRENNNLELGSLEAYLYLINDQTPVKAVAFADSVEVVQTFASPTELTTVDEATAHIVGNNKLSVLITQEESYREDYELETIYVDNPKWYTTKTEVQEEGEDGIRDVIALVTYHNGVEVSRQITHEDIIEEAKAAVVKRGTKEPPSFIRPLKIGSFSSGFGRRWGRMHEGVDWSCRVGTNIYASATGTVSSAGWENGYGYCVVINHGGGFKTRYAHLSELHCSAGDKVEQGQKIAESGNTGRSTGPHLHFEILINGEPVNPFNYI